MAGGKKSTGARKSKPKNQITRRPKSMSNFDGQNLFISQYFEVKATQGPNTDGVVMGYTIGCDVNNCVVKLKAEGTGALIEAKHGLAVPKTIAGVVQPVAATGDNVITFDRFTNFKSIYRQYKVNAVKISVTADRECGLDNPIIFLTDKGESNPEPLVSIAQAMGQAHREFQLTDSKRTCQYGWKPSTAQEKEYQMLHSNIGEADLTQVKVLQELKGKNAGTCTHKVMLQMLVTLKDSKSSLN